MHRRISKEAGHEARVSEAAKVKAAMLRAGGNDDDNNGGDGDRHGNHSSNNSHQHTKTQPSSAASAVAAAAATSTHSNNLESEITKPTPMSPEDIFPFLNEHRAGEISRDPVLLQTSVVEYYGDVLLPDGVTREAVLTSYGAAPSAVGAVAPHPPGGTTTATAAIMSPLGGGPGSATPPASLGHATHRHSSISVPSYAALQQQHLSASPYNNTTASSVALLSSTAAGANPAATQEALRALAPGPAAALSQALFHGHGRLVSTLGYTYTGSFDRGLMHGSGRIEWADGTSYEGSLVNGVVNGTGRYAWPGGDTYEGEVRNSVRHGKGTFFLKMSGEAYEGEWFCGMRHGYGLLKYATQSENVLASRCQYAGLWQQDKKHGRGTMTYSSGDAYDGEWDDDRRHGHGTMVWKQHGLVVEVYSGEWVMGIQEGYGQSTYIRPSTAASLVLAPAAGASSSGSGSGAAAGATSASSGASPPTGAARRQSMTGLGTSISNGSFTGNRPPATTITAARFGASARGPSATATAATPPLDISSLGASAALGGSSTDGPAAVPHTPSSMPLTPNETSGTLAVATRERAINTYAGEYVQGLRHGFGVFTYDDGSSYEGMWAHNHRHGHGKLTDANGVVFVGQFEHGNPLSQKDSALLAAQPQPVSGAPSGVGSPTNPSLLLSPNSDQQPTIVVSGANAGATAAATAGTVAAAAAPLAVSRHPAISEGPVPFLSGLSAQVPLHINDVLGVAEVSGTSTSALETGNNDNPSHGQQQNNSTDPAALLAAQAAGLTAVQLVVSRHFGILKKLFHFYSAMGVSASGLPDGSTTTGMSANESFTASLLGGSGNNAGGGNTNSATMSVEVAAVPNGQEPRPPIDGSTPSNNTTAGGTRNGTNGGPGGNSPLQTLRSPLSAPTAFAPVSSHTPNSNSNSNRLHVLGRPSWRAGRPQGTMHILQFLRLLSDARVLNSKGVTMAAVGRALAGIRDQHSTTAASVLASGGTAPPPPTAATATVGAPATTTATPTTVSGTAQPSSARRRGEGATTATNNNNNNSSTDPAAVSNSSFSSIASGLNNNTQRYGSLRSLNETARNNSNNTKYRGQWREYRQQLHTLLTGHLTFRDFVEALVRVAAIALPDAVFGTTARRLNALIEEYLMVFAVASVATYSAANTATTTGQQQGGSMGAALRLGGSGGQQQQLQGIPLCAASSSSGIRLMLWSPVASTAAKYILQNITNNNNTANANANAKQQAQVQQLSQVLQGRQQHAAALAAERYKTMTYIKVLEELFEKYASAAAITGAAGGLGEQQTAQRRPSTLYNSLSPDVLTAAAGATMTIRQLLLMLRDLGTAVINPNYAAAGSPTATSSSPAAAQQPQPQPLPAIVGGASSVQGSAGSVQPYGLVVPTRVVVRKKKASTAALLLGATSAASVASITPAAARAALKSPMALLVAIANGVYAMHDPYAATSTAVLQRQFHADAQRRRVEAAALANALSMTAAISAMSPRQGSTTRSHHTAAEAADTNGAGATSAASGAGTGGGARRQPSSSRLPVGGSSSHGATANSSRAPSSCGSQSDDEETVPLHHHASRPSVTGGAGASSFSRRHASNSSLHPHGTGNNNSVAGAGLHSGSFLNHSTRSTLSAAGATQRGPGTGGGSFADLADDAADAPPLAVPALQMQPSNNNNTTNASGASTSNNTLSFAQALSASKAATAETEASAADKADAAFRADWALRQLSKGVDRQHEAAALVADREIVFAEFVDICVSVALVVSAALTPTPPAAQGVSTGRAGRGQSTAAAPPVPISVRVERFLEQVLVPLHSRVC